MKPSTPDDSDSKVEFVRRIREMGKMDKEKRNRVVCALLGHSKIQTTFFGYYYCSRCEAQVGDTLGSVYDAAPVVIVAHDCEVCRKNYKALDWKHKLYAKNPFPKKGAA